MAQKDEISRGRVLRMYVALCQAEVKNSRTNEYEDKEMVKRITRYIEQEVAKANAAGKDADE